MLPGGGCALPGLQRPPVSSYPRAHANTAPPGRYQAPSSTCCRMALRLPGLQRPPVSSYPQAHANTAPPGRYQAPSSTCCRVAAAPYPAYKDLPSAHIPRPTLTQRRQEGIRLRAQHVAGWRFAYPAYKGCPRFGALFAPFVGPRKRSAAGQGQRARSRFCAGWRLRLTRPTKPGPPVPSSRQTPRSAPPGSYCACCCACASWRTIASRRASPSGSRASNACRAATASG
ncbi:hypothetical protein KLQUMA228M_16715 [Klebsiella quasipneumoniae subsp. quasipneumoniae]|nr:hypothetical protein SB01124_02049 [Klebsiella quasipneumoniae subsp. quasipneumoniae]